MYRYLLAVLLILTFNISVQASRCNFNVPSVDLDVCKSLNNSKSVKDSPYYMKNPNTLCGMTFDMPGLPTLDLSLGKYIKPIDGCKVIKAITGSSAKKEIKEALKKVLEFKS